MALENCKECAKEISTKAKICPHCGYKRQSEFWQWIKAIILFFIVLIVVMLTIGSFIDKNDEPSASQFEQLTPEQKTYLYFKHGLEKEEREKKRFE